MLPAQKMYDIRGQEVIVISLLYVIINCTKSHSSLDVYSVNSEFLDFVQFPFHIALDRPAVEIVWFYVVHI